MNNCDFTLLLDTTGDTHCQCFTPERGSPPGPQTPFLQVPRSAQAAVLETSAPQDFIS